MQTIVKPSLVLVALVTLVSAGIFLTGLHQNFMVGQMVFLALAIAINVAVVVWSLSKTAATHGYAQQLGNAAGIGLLAGILIVATSWLLMAVVFPNALAETRDAAIAYMDTAGMSEADVAKQMTALDATTALSQSLPGGMGTFVTSLVTGAVFAIFRRKK
jgi:hypothetical protein